MDAVLEITRKRAFDLVARAYSWISVDDFSAFMGLSVGEASNVALAEGWKLDVQKQMIAPCLPEKPPEPTIPSEQQLDQLTDFVSFLEN
jgi:hypothetical protein